MILLRNLTIKHYVTVKNGPGGIGNGFVEVVAVYQYCIKARDGAFVASALIAAFALSAP